MITIMMMMGSSSRMGIYGYATITLELVEEIRDV